MLCRVVKSSEELPASGTWCNRNYRMISSIVTIYGALIELISFVKDAEPLVMRFFIFDK